MNDIGFSWQAFKHKWDMLNVLLPAEYLWNSKLNGLSVWRNR